jgi:hypothetical protein
VRGTLPTRERRILLKKVPRRWVTKERAEAAQRGPAVFR